MTDPQYLIRIQPIGQDKFLDITFDGSALNCTGNLKLALGAKLFFEELMSIRNATGKSPDSNSETKNP